MDVRNARGEPTIEHEGTCLTYFMFPKESVRAETMGSYLEYVAEFELKPGAHLQPHYHDTDEFYRILSGRAIVQVGTEQKLLIPGDLLHIPRNEPHSIWPAVEGESFRALSFAVSYMKKVPGDINCELPVPTRVATPEDVARS
jgi:mannose-6-phosphate isomerase-like protein (cupin superfamily)